MHRMALRARFARLRYTTYTTNCSTPVTSVLAAGTVAARHTCRARTPSAGGRPTGATCGAVGPGVVDSLIRGCVLLVFGLRRLAGAGRELARPRPQRPARRRCRSRRRACLTGTTSRSTFPPHLGRDLRICRWGKDLKRLLHDLLPCRVECNTHLRASNLIEL